MILQRKLQRFCPSSFQSQLVPVKKKIFVGNNKYRLGWVVPKDRCIYLPWKRSFKVLTINKDAVGELVSNAKDAISHALMIRNSPKDSASILPLATLTVVCPKMLNLHQQARKKASGTVVWWESHHIRLVHMRSKI